MNIIRATAPEHEFTIMPGKEAETIVRRRVSSRIDTHQEDTVTMNAKELLYYSLHQPPHESIILFENGVTKIFNRFTGKVQLLKLV